jgi:Protein of unknown function (DUF3892)
MAEYQVTCIDKLDHLSLHERITHIGNLEDQWRLTVEGAIYQIEKKVSQFYTLDRSTRKRSYLEVVRELGKAPYLKAHADGKWTDDLLTQGECDENCRVVS